LYAYVSRGKLRSEPGSGRRDRRYRRDEVEWLVQTRTTRRQPARSLQTALAWGPPILETKLTTVRDNKLYYRGLDASELALSRSFNEAAYWFWTQEFEALPAPDSQVTIKHPPPPGLALRRFKQSLVQTRSQPLTAALPRSVYLPVAADLVRMFLQKLTGGQQRSLSAAGTVLRQCWSPSRAQVDTLINAILVLCLDHELNVSAFTARVVASAGATLPEVLLAALCAFGGVRHGGAVSRARAALIQLLNGTEPGRVFEFEAGRAIAGFGHPLYPDGDCRAALILRLLAPLPGAKIKPVLRAIERSAIWLGKSPNLDLALAACECALGWPEESGTALFALGRSAGWIGHALEQMESGQLIRPRARYVGGI
jgi:citrate synthase